MKQMIAVQPTSDVQGGSSQQPIKQTRQMDGVGADRGKGQRDRTSTQFLSIVCDTCEQMKLQF